MNPPGASLSLISNTWQGLLESLFKHVFGDFSQKTETLSGDSWSKDNHQKEALSTDYTEIVSHPALKPSYSICKIIFKKSPKENHTQSF